MPTIFNKRDDRKDIGILILRIIIGEFIFYGHGLHKWLMFIGDGSIEFIDPIGIGMKTSFILVLFAEGVCFLFLILGLFTRLAIIPLIITMFVASFIYNQNASFENTELPLIYFFSIVALYLTGPGKYSIDYLIQKRSLRKKESRING